MTIHLGAHASAPTNNSPVVPAPSVNTTGGPGSVFVVYIGWFFATDTPVVTGTIGGVADGNTYGQVGSTFLSTTGGRGAVFDCPGFAGGNAHVITANFQAPNTALIASIWIVELLNGAVVSIRDAAPGGNDAVPPNFQALATGALAQAVEAVLAFTSTASSSGTEAFTWLGGFASTGDPQTNANANQTGDAAFLVTASSASVQATFNSSGAGTTNAIVFAVSYKDAAGGISVTGVHIGDPVLLMPDTMVLC